MRLVFFLIEGTAAFVLAPSQENVPYVIIEKGDTFGIIDLVASKTEATIQRELRRQFNVMALETVDVLSLNLEVGRVERMRIDFVVVVICAVGPERHQG